MNKNYLKMIPFVILLVISISGMIHEYSHLPPSMPGLEFRERFDDDPVVKHFLAKYPNYYVGFDHAFGMILPAWEYTGSVRNEYGINLATLQLYDNFGKYEFIYICSDFNETYAYVRISNPTIEDIDKNPC